MDFDFDDLVESEVDDQNSFSKYSMVNKQLKDQEKEERDGFQMEVDDIDEEINQDDLDVNDLLQNNDGYGTSWSK